MAIHYRTQPVVNNPGVFYLQAIEQGILGPQDAIREIAEKTQQTEAVVTAVLSGAGQVLVESILAGQGIYLPGVGKATFSIEATVTDQNAPPPADRRVRVRVEVDRSLVSEVNSQAELVQLGPENLNPILTNVRVDNGVITALNSSALITFRGSRLRMLLTDSTQGVYLQGPTGAPIKVDNARIKSHTGTQIEFFWPPGLTANTTYDVYIKGCAPGTAVVRTSNSMSDFHNT